MVEMERKAICRYLVLPILIVPLLTASSASDPKIINSADWKDSLSAATFFSGQKTLVRNPGDAEQVASEYGDSAVVISSRKEPGFSGLSSIVGTEDIGFSYSTVYSNSSDMDTIYIINPHFASEALTVLPEATRKNASLTFYSEQHLEKLQGKGQEKVFVGSYEDSPWKKTEESSRLHADSPGDLNRQFIRKHYQGGPVVLTDPGSPGFSSLLTEQPVLLTNNAEQDARLLDDLGVQFLKVIGSENTGYASRLQSLTSNDLRIAAKVGRALASRETASLYDVRSLETDVRDNSLSISDAVYDQNDGRLRLTVEPSADSRIILENLSIREGENTRQVGLGHYISLSSGAERNLVLDVPEGLTPTGISLKGAINGLEWKNSTSVSLADLDERYTSAGINREGSQIKLDRESRRLYIRRGEDVERLDAEELSGIDPGEGGRLTLISGDTVYLTDVPDTETPGIGFYFAGIVAAALVSFFSFVAYRELTEDSEPSK